MDTVNTTRAYRWGYPAVIPSVNGMTSPRRAYDDASSTARMAADARAVEAALQLPERRSDAERARRAAVRPAPSIRYEDYPREVAKPRLEVSEAAARLAAALHLR